MSASRIILNLARSPGTGFADGDDRRGYIIVAPLGPDGRLDAAAYAANPGACTVRHVAEGERPRLGRLSRRGSHWFIDYDLRTTDEESAFRLGEDPFRIGDYVTFSDAKDVPWTYRVADIKPA